MPIFEHQIPEDVRDQSRWRPDYAAYQTADGRWWKYTDDPEGRRVAWQNWDGSPIAVAVWLQAPDD